MKNITREKLIKAGKNFKEGNSVRKLQKVTSDFTYDDYNDLSKEPFFITLMIILGSIGYSPNNTVYCIVTSLLKLCSFFGENIFLILLGEKSTGKSGLKDLIFTEDIECYSECPTIPNLRGEVKGDNSDKVPLEKKGILIEEAGNMDNTIFSKTLGFFKEVWGSKSFKKNNKDVVTTKTNVTFILNNYSTFKNLKDIKRNNLVSDLPSVFKTDEAIYDRFFMILPHYNTTLGKIKYVDPEQLVIPIVNLEKILSSFQEMEIDLNLEKYGIEGRDYRNFSATIKLIGCIFFYSRIKEAKSIPEWFIKGLLEFIKHFNSIAKNSDIYIPFNSNSAIFILNLLGFDTEKVEFVLFHEERILIKQKEEDYFHKIALTGYGIEQNRKEMEFYKENPDKVIEILSLTEDGIRMKQKYANIYSSQIIAISSDFKKKTTDEEYNKLIIKLIQKGGEVSEYNFRGIPDFIIKIAYKIIKDYFGKSEKNISKKNYVLSNGSIKLLNFGEFIVDKNMTIKNLN